MPMSHTPMTHSPGQRRKGRHAGSAPSAREALRAVRAQGAGRAASLTHSRPRAAPVPVRRVKALALAGALLLSLLVAGGAGAFSHLWTFLDYGAGVLSLVSLTATVLWGLAATDRLVLHSDHRLLAQGVHRGLATAGLGFLVLHIWVKVAEHRTSATAVAVPFTDRSQPLLIGLGSLAGYLFVAVAVTGAVRSVFASGGGSARWRSRWWRALHMAAYPAWGAALVHGLKSGRPAAGWVTAGYALCLLGVAVALAIRIRTASQPATGAAGAKGGGHRAGGTGGTGPIPIPAQRGAAPGPPRHTSLGPGPGPQAVLSPDPDLTTTAPLPVQRPGQPPTQRPDEPLGALRGWGP